MPRRSRVHVRNGLYYVRHYSRAGRLIFSTPNDYVEFEAVLAPLLKLHHVTLYAFCWRPNSIHMACQISDTPLGDFMRALMSGYRLKILHTRPCGEVIFQRRYRDSLIDPRFLPHLVRHIHRIACTHDSERAYAGFTSIRWLNQREVLKRFAKQVKQAREQYLAFMDEPIDPLDADFFEYGGKVEPQPMSAPALRQSVLRRPRTRTLQDIIDAVLFQQAVEWSDVISRSRDSEHVLARALITWHAMALDIATRSDVARVVQHSESSLRQAVARHRKLRPELFQLGALRWIAPLVSLPAGR